MAQVITGQFTAVNDVSPPITCARAAIHLTLSATGEVEQEYAVDDVNFIASDNKKSTSGVWEYIGVSMPIRLKCTGLGASATIDYVIRTP